MKFRILAAGLVLFLVMVANSFAQNEFQTWLTYNIQTRLSQKWGYTFDLNYRTRGFFPFQSNLAAMRGGAVYFLNEQWRFSGGYAWFGTYVNQINDPWLTEHRIWQQAIWLKRNSKFIFTNRVRLEQRFRQFEDFFWKGSTEETFTHRYRYMFQAQGVILPAARDNGFQLSWQAANELMLQTGDLTGGREFNQNRTLAGLVISPNRQIDMAVLYQHIFQYQPKLLEVEQVQSIRVTFLHLMDFR